MKENFDVVVVGAGLSGLTAVYHLQQAGLKTAVLEARSRVGGRILTAQHDPINDGFDLGPTWYWSHQANIISLLKQFNLPSFEQYETGYVLLERHAKAQPEKIMPDWQQPTSYRVVGGMIAIINALIQRIEPHTVLLDHQVQAITAQDGQTLAVQAITNGKPTTWHAKHVIVTLPPHLAASTIRYEPALPVAVEQAMRQTPTWMGEAMKVSLVYKRPFWRDQGASGMAVSYAGPVQQFLDASPADQSIGALFGWVGNHSAGRDLPEAERKTAVIAQATKLFGQEAAHPLHYSEINWERDPFTTNQHAQDRVLAIEHPAYGHPLLQQPQGNGRLWWATTEVSPVEGGYLDGAIYSGQTVANTICQFF